MYLTETLQKKWQPVLEHEDLPKIDNAYRRAVTTVLLENQEQALREAAPVNSMGASSSTAGDGHVDIWDPVLISLVRRAMPQLIAYDAVSYTHLRAHET